MSMVSVCLSSDALLQHLPSYLGFSYLGRGVSLHGCSSKAQPLLLTLDEGYPVVLSSKFSISIPVNLLYEMHGVASYLSFYLFFLIKWDFHPAGNIRY